MHRFASMQKHTGVSCLFLWGGPQRSSANRENCFVSSSGAYPVDTVNELVLTPLLLLLLLLLRPHTAVASCARRKLREASACCGTTRPHRRRSASPPLPPRSWRSLSLLPRTPPGSRRSRCPPASARCVTITAQLLRTKGAGRLHADDMKRTMCLFPTDLHKSADCSYGDGHGPWSIRHVLGHDARVLKVTLCNGRILS